jgi:hypothetical protein
MKNTGRILYLFPYVEIDVGGWIILGWILERLDGVRWSELA